MSYLVTTQSPPDYQESRPESSIPAQSSTAAANQNNRLEDPSMSREDVTQSDPTGLVLRHGAMQSTAHSSSLTHDLGPYQHDQIQQTYHQGHHPSSTTASSFDLPVSVVMGAASTIHNLPKLYGDRTVRENKKVTGLVSGLKEAGKELGYGFYDGFSGLVTMPIRGAVKSGPIGCAKGLVQGSMGVLVKPVAGVSGLAAYTIKGIHKEFEKRSVKAEALEVSNAFTAGIGSGSSFEVRSVKKISRSQYQPTNKSERRLSSETQTTYQESRMSEETLHPDDRTLSDKSEKHDMYLEAEDNNHDGDLPPYEALDYGRVEHNRNELAESSTVPALALPEDGSSSAIEGVEDGAKEYAKAKGTSSTAGTGRSSFMIRDSVRIVTDERYSAVLDEGHAIVFSQRKPHEFFLDEKEV